MEDYMLDSNQSDCAVFLDLHDGTCSSWQLQWNSVTGWLKPVAQYAYVQYTPHLCLSWDQFFNTWQWKRRTTSATKITEGNVTLLLTDVTDLFPLCHSFVCSTLQYSVTIINFIYNATEVDRVTFLRENLQILGRLWKLWSAMNRWRKTISLSTVVICEAFWRKVLHT